MTRLSAAFGRLLDGLAVIAALILFGMVVLVTADILLRNITVRGFVWANEVSEYALYMMTLLTGPWLLRRGQHVRLDLVLSAIPRRLAWLMEAAGDVFGFVVCLGMVYYGFLMTSEAWQLGSITIKNLVFPEWWLLAPMPATFGLIAIEFIFRFHRILRVRDLRQEATSVA
ncbi:MAG: TRAP transporter small permease [Pseudorhodoplanes sp.]|nr:TRAP transporter small permease [Pseudorhodoplanes sp.]